MVNLEQALNCIQAMQKNGTYEGQRIGMVREDIRVGLGITYTGFEPGRIVLYTPENEKKVTIESPMTEESIEEQRQKGSLLTTTGTTVCVPRHYIVDIVDLLSNTYGQSNRLKRTNI